MNATLKTIDGNRLGDGFGFIFGPAKHDAELTLAGAPEKWNHIKYFNEYLLEVADGRRFKCYVKQVTPISLGSNLLVTLNLQIMEPAMQSNPPTGR